MVDHKEIFGIQILEGTEGTQMGKAGFFCVKDILFIDLWEPKKNYRVPRFHTRSGVYTVALTLESCRLGFPNLVSLDNGNLVNLDQVDYIDPTAFGIIVRFKGTNITTSMAQYKEKHFKHLLKENNNSN
ncbi:dipeptidyl aminopeptidase [Paenibacillus solani]|uniref:dipeptidyl aminopeptidase n=1 Tax=Paenibacillus solani TaxID=1705565 RepID=UPI003D28DD1D